MGFDAASDISGRWGNNTGVFPSDDPSNPPALDTLVKASGNSSLRFTIPPNIGSNMGSYFANFSPDLSVQFGANSEFYVQWRQRFSLSFLANAYQGGGGWKQGIVGTGDKPGCSPSTYASGSCYSSCTALEVVVQNSYQRGFPEMYNSCTGSASHGPYNAFEQPYGSSDFKLQNAMPSPFCLYSQGYTSPPSYFPPAGNCFAYFPDEWMTFQVHIKLGAWVNGEFVGSYVQLWVAREGQPSKLVINWGPYNLTADPSSAIGQQYGKIWLLPYNTNKSATVTYPIAYTWYDELIISRNRIADPK